MQRIRPLLATFLLLVLAAVPALGDHGGIHPTFRTENVFFTCPGPTKVHQANWALTLADESSYPGWTTNPPSQSVQEGAGCGALDWGGTTNPVYSPVFRGTFEGNLQAVTVRIHQFVTHGVRQDATETLRLSGDIDGVPIFPPGAQPADGRTVQVTPSVANSGVTELYEFTITNLGFADPVVDGDGNVIDVQTGGAVKEDGDGTRQRMLTLYLGLHGTPFSLNPNDPQGYKAATWVWDTTEVPSGLVFNPSEPAAATVAADLPALSW